ncbi:aldehyde dehydrogenase (NADP(+)) [Agrococcus terreus]|uniref:2,5-dioxovalerate dehydrogenase n=1 Tax=Agrococcus terreus TaxID=574649 RepID=A0ABQ2KNE0_9MICO|nr:aldehyde dehydrogenase (NADP(+)) [Agrococcus terreus]GGN88533.1 2,5-dioxovalerate dehydrogenase [Agrococcus terreus]
MSAVEVAERAALTGESFVAGRRRRGTAGEVRGVDAATGERLEPAFGLATRQDAADAAAAAAEAAPVLRAAPPATRAALLRGIADGLDAASGQLVDRARLETGLPQARLVGEVGRTSGQLRLFAGLVESGLSEGLRIDPALPDRAPAPRPELRQRRLPLGPVVVFGASNFPFAFSNAGGDTASALAAGCPVIVKSHQAHPGVAELVSAIVVEVVERLGLPAGTYQALLGSGREVGTALVEDPRVRAVGFTGSRSGGLALVRAARERPVPIPVYAEMSSVNPVVVLPSAATAERGRAFVDSLLLGAGQFCTNPGLVLVPSGEAGEPFVAAAAEALAARDGQVMLTEGIRDAYVAGRDALAGRGSRIAEGGGAERAPAPSLVEAAAADLVAEPALADEVFGATGLVLRWGDERELRAALAALEGQLTATVHVDLDDAPDDERSLAADLVIALEELAGRIVVNGWPTGVEVGHAVVHGGPFPATSDGRSTSVGSLAIERFQRPVAYQDVPEALLPAALRDDAIAALPRLVDGAVVLP